MCVIALHPRAEVQSPACCTLCCAFVLDLRSFSASQNVNRKISGCCVKQLELSLAQLREDTIPQPVVCARGGALTCIGSLAACKGVPPAHSQLIILTFSFSRASSFFFPLPRKACSSFKRCAEGGQAVAAFRMPFSLSASCTARAAARMLQ